MPTLLQALGLECLLIHGPLLLTNLALCLITTMEPNSMTATIASVRQI